MRRIVTWILSTITVVVLMFGYHTSTSGALSAQDTVLSPTTGPGTGGSAATHGPAGAKQSQTVTGPVVETQWGPVQVQVSLAGDTLEDVTILQHPSGNPQDDMINGYALPVLVQETLSAQSANIDMVSGATVTSSGYQQSLQAALDQVGL